MVFSLVRSIYRANRSTNKKEYLEEFLDDFEILKLEVRLAYDMRILAIRHHVEISKLMDDIGKQINAWRRSG